MLWDKIFLADGLNDKTKQKGYINMNNTKKELQKTYLQFAGLCFDQKRAKFAHYALQGIISVARIKNQSVVP